MLWIKFRVHSLRVLRGMNPKVVEALNTGKPLVSSVWGERVVTGR